MGFHDGELAVQRLAGVQDEAARLVGMLDPGELAAGAARFLAELSFAALTARDRAGRLWTSPLVGSPGFLDGSGGDVLRIAASPRPGDPLADLPAGQQVGLLVIDPARRRRVRINGKLSHAGDDVLEVEIVEAFGNCPKYIRRRVVASDGTRSPTDPDVDVSTTVDVAARDLITAADTFFLGTTHPDRGPDASHRGGPAGFVEVHDGRLLWSDLPGNNMFTSFGNLCIDQSAALLFVDVGTGATLHLSGLARVEWAGPGAAGDEGQTGRRVRFAPERVVHVRTPLPVTITPID